MPQLIEMKTLKITSRGQITLPKSIRDIVGLHEGEKALLLAYDDHIELMNERMMTALLSERSLSKEWNTPEEDEAWKEL